MSQTRKKGGGRKRQGSKPLKDSLATKLVGRHEDIEIQQNCERIFAFTYAWMKEAADGTATNRAV